MSEHFAEWVSAYLNKLSDGSVFSDAPVLGVLGIALYVLALTVLILDFVALWKIFEKAGEKGWKALIPFYNLYVLFKLVWDRNAFWLMLAFAVLFAGGLLAALDAAVFHVVLADAAFAVLPGLIVMAVSAVILVILELFLVHRLSLSFGHRFAFFLGLLFLSPVFLLILGFGTSVYKGHWTPARE